MCEKSYMRERYGEVEAEYMTQRRGLVWLD